MCNSHRCRAFVIQYLTYIILWKGISVLIYQKYRYLDIVKLLKWIVGNQTLIDRIWDMNSLIHDTIMVRQDLSFFEYLLIDGYTNSPWHIQNVGATSYDFSYRVRDFAPHYNFCRHIKLQKTHLVIAKVLPLEILQFCLFCIWRCFFN